VRITTTTADASPASGSLYLFSQIIEGFNISDLGFGAAGASTVTLSFWVRSSLAGTFSGSLKNGNAYNRSYPFTFTINAANTWEYKTITVAGDTSGTWETGNLGGLIINLDLGCGSSLLSSANTWQAGNFNGVTGSTRLISTNGATFDIAGVQLEKGSVATAFDYRPYGTEFLLCQRYYQFSDIWANYIYIYGATIPPNYGIKSVQFYTPMRTDATVVAYNEAGTANRFSINRGGAYTAGYITQSYGFTMTNGTGGNISGSEVTFSWRASAEL
jgi:hypothetical protein